MRWGLFWVACVSWIGVVVSAWADVSPQLSLDGEQAVVEVDCSQSAARANRLLLGQNLPVSISGIWNSGANGINEACEILVRGIAPSVIRFPGGGFSDLYIWEDGLSVELGEAAGPQDRTLTLSAAPSWKRGGMARFLGPLGGGHGAPFRFLGTEKNVLVGLEKLSRTYPAGTPIRIDARPGQPRWFQNAFGVAELIRVSEMLGAQLILTVNFSTGIDRLGNVSTMASLDQRVKRAMAWLAFMNGDVSDHRSLGSDAEGNDWKTVGYWAGRRVASGRAEPLRVVYWEVGNELFFKSEVGNTTADQYARGFVRFSKAMKHIDPGIKVGACGMTDPFALGDNDRRRQWNRTLLEIAGEEMDFMAVHPYDPSALSSQVSFHSESWFKGVMTGASQALDRLEKNFVLMRECGPVGKQLEIVVSEYGIWPADSRNPRDFSNIARAVHDADLLMHLLKEGWRLRVTMATGWNLQSTTETALIRHDWSTGSCISRPQYHSFRMVRQLAEGRQVPVTVHCSLLDSSRFGKPEAGRDIPVLAGAAFLGEGDLLRLMVINRHLSKTVYVKLFLKNWKPMGKAVATVLSGPSASAHNEDLSSAVEPTVQEVHIRQDPIVHSFPPHSVTLMEFEAESRRESVP